MKSDQVIQGFINFTQDARDGERGRKLPFLSGMRGLDERQSVE